jgi:hypothetical protein
MSQPQHKVPGPQIKNSLYLHVLGFIDSFLENSIRETHFTPNSLILQYTHSLNISKLSPFTLIRKY